MDILEEPKQETKTYLQFLLGNKQYAIEIDYVIEIIELQPVTEIPDMPANVTGVINLRGNVITLVDISQTLGLVKNEQERGCIVIVNIDDKKYGLVVDNVEAVLDIPQVNIDIPSGIDVNNSITKGTEKLEGGLCIVLDLTHLL